MGCLVEFGWIQVQEKPEIWLDIDYGYTRVGVEEQCNVGETGVRAEVGVSCSEMRGLQRKKLCRVQRKHSA